MMSTGRACAVIIYYLRKLFLLFALYAAMRIRVPHIISETHKELKGVTLICLFCPMLLIFHFRKYHIWNEKKR